MPRCRRVASAALPMGGYSLLFVGSVVPFLPELRRRGLDELGFITSMSGDCAGKELLEVFADGSCKWQFQ